ncbi:beta-lactamase regulating signal transducer with metallopeptidase domain/biopolymer transport protein ExbD [Saonia flava]|uniref:Beta-lactamase regulating signal transducer with metallopeptidase domain/biopolymer transport protein ExbD n=1 Tax=Saonia flava TaxID=523696 RepID=A0A846QWS3_9FLAO|nr:M56 family metallopeptidase [Saonia flava]NJB71032.1 beta-lactamase regulating signal transducer with metallopeptidase domain/biopolymer transport protein ExbD [Saonia flava]
MLVYILKSGGCLAILFLFYKLFLEKENMHRFKRFYLLLSLALALIIPTLVFTEYIETTELTNSEIVHFTSNSNEVINVPPALKSDILDIEPLLWVVYLIGLFFFGIKFTKNLFQILWRVRKNPKQILNRFTQVLLQEKLPPHTFFKYIFLNKKKLESNKIPKEVLLHEETHAQQKHSYDVVFIELLQVVFWFNPFIYLFKKAIKLNHEFLADQAVLQKDITTKNYQNTLLSYLSHDSQKKYQPELANAINYSSIKKRFTIMKTKTSKKGVLFRSLLPIPLIALLLFGFSETKIIQKENEAINISTELNYPIEISGEQLLEYNVLAKKYNTLPIEKRVIPIEDLKVLETLYKKMSDVQKRGAQPFPECPPTKPQKTVKEIIININKNGQLLVQSDLVKLENLENYLSKINAHLSFDERKKIIRSVIKTDPKTPKNVIEKVDKILTEYGSATINFIGVESGITKKIQESATRKEMAEYTKLAKKYNAMSKNNFEVKSKEVERLKYIYNKMSDKQRADAESFPDFPAPPPAPNAPGAVNLPPPPPMKFPVTDSEVAKIESSPAIWPESLRNASPPPPTQQKNGYKSAAIDSIINNKEIAAIDKIDFYVSEPPTPPTPPSPLDHAIEMAKQGATFYHGKKKITSDEAISLLKRDGDLSMEVSRKNNNPPVVKISRYLN